jgi:ethanolamine ammonia-lyase small subunit
MKLGNTDGWAFLKQYTGARIALGRAGISLLTKDVLDFQLAHARARDAVYEELDSQLVANQLEPFFPSISMLESRVKTKTEYLQRPDLGRRLEESSSLKWESEVNKNGYDIQIIVADGLSSTAIHTNAFAFIETLFSKLPSHFSIAPLAVVKYGRVAIADEIGQISKSSISIILIGERPGLSAPDSMGIYLTYGPKVGNTDESRNCISNIRPQGLTYNLATDKLIYLITESLRLKISGVSLKENQILLE